MAKETVEALLNPSLRVSRPVAACARCRSAKIKCDGKLPACSACERSGKSKECSSLNDDFARGKERSYVAALETTIQRLNKKIADAQKRSGTAARASSGLPNGDRPSLQRRPMSGSRRKEASDVDELVSDFGFLTVNATSRDFHGFTSTMSFTRLLMATSTKKQLPQMRESLLPSRYDIAPLINHYFQNIYVMLPFFSETEFMGSLSRVYQESISTTPIPPTDIWFVRLVLAIASAATCQTKGDAKYEAAIQHISAAMKLAEYVLHPGSLIGIQALLLLVQYALVDPEYFDCWYLIGMASRLTVDLGLHSEPPAEVKISKHALDLRRRIFYCTYALDRQISMALGLAFTFTDDSAPNVLLPTLATDLEKQSPSQLFLRSIRPSLFLFDIRRVQSAFYQMTRWSARREWSHFTSSEYVSSILNDIQSWHSTLPSSFSESHLHTFFIEYLYSQVLIVAPSNVTPIATVTDANKARVFHFATQYADQMQMMVQNIESQCFLTYADICRARFVAKQFQAVMWASFDHILKMQHILVGEQAVQNITPLDNCTRAISFLNKISQILDFARQRWSIADLREKFAQETAVLLARLKNKQQEFSQVQQTNAPISYESGQNMITIPNLVQQGTQYQDSAYGNYQYQSTNTIHSQTSPAQHRANLSRGSSWETDMQQQQPQYQQNYDMQQGSLPR